MPMCDVSPENKRAMGVAVGEDLVRHHGKKPYYTVKEVQEGVQRRGYAVDWSCWALCLYTSPADFNEYHHSLGEDCDYASMKGEMVSAMTEGASDSWFDADLSWLEWPDIDLSSIFGSIDL